MDNFCNKILGNDFGERNPHPIPSRLAELYPQEVRFFARRFIWASNTSGFYTRHGYGQGHPWRARKTVGERWLPVYPGLAADLIEKHLDFERFCRFAPEKSPVHPRKEETAFWLGMAAGEKTYYDCIDVDSHDTIGTCGVPSRFHPERDPYRRDLFWHEHRNVPVVRVGLDYFMKLRLFHEHFPGRIWSFSSASLGMYLYRMHPRAIDARKQHGAMIRLLKALRMDVLGGVRVEVYPEPPKTPGSKGHQQRRPCGTDMGVITERGIVTDPIGQIRLFMEPQTPSFEAIVDAVIARMTERYRTWLAYPSDSDKPKERLFEEQLAEIERVRTWLGDGCPGTERLLNGAPRSVATPPVPSPPQALDGGPAPLPDTIGSTLQGTGSGESNDLEDIGDRRMAEMFVRCDLEAINRSRQWVPFALFLAEHGFPGEDTFVPVVSTLTRWLYYYEFFDVRPESIRRSRIKEVLRLFSLKKHNGFITRLANDRVEEVLSNVDRLVDHTIESVNDQGKLTFMLMRSKRDRGCYRTIYEIEAMLLSDTPSLQSSLCPISCGVIRGEEVGSETGWEYVPDDTPLPEDLERSILRAFVSNGYEMRKRGGEYPLIRAVTRLINYLAASPSCQRRASQVLLAKMGFPTNSRRRERIKGILRAHEIIVSGGYRSKKESRKYVLTDRVMEELASTRSRSSLAS